MARKRATNTICPLCGGRHYVEYGDYLYRIPNGMGINSVAWMGFKTAFYCNEKGTTVRVWKLYDDDYKYVGYETLWCDDGEIPF